LALQSPDLVMVALGIRGDAPPVAEQPPLVDGAHLRWATSRSRTFPWHGFFLFRRQGQKEGREVCVSPQGQEGRRQEAARHRIAGCACRMAGAYGAGRPDRHSPGRRCDPAARPGAAALWPHAAVAPHGRPASWRPISRTRRSAAWGVGPEGRHFYIRQLRDVKLSPLVETFDAEMLSIYGKMCGWVLARAHAKAGDPWAISGYLGKNAQFDEAMGKFALAYADQAERDHAALRAPFARAKSRCNWSIEGDHPPSE